MQNGYRRDGLPRERSERCNHVVSVEFRESERFPRAIITGLGRLLFSHGARDPVASVESGGQMRPKGRVYPVGRVEKRCEEKVGFVLPLFESDSYKIRQQIGFVVDRQQQERKLNTL